MDDYAPDGAYPEGYGYWDYGTSFNVMLLGALEKLYGTDFGLSARPGFLRTGGYMANMAGPTGAGWNYADAGAGAEFHPAMFFEPSHAYDSPNPGTSMVGFEILVPANTRRTLRVVLTPARGVIVPR